MSGSLQHNKVFLNFTNETGQVASVGFAIASSSPISTQAGLAAWGLNMATWIQANLGSSLTGLMDAATSLNNVKACYMNGTTQVAAATALLSTPKAGTGTTPLPAQVSCVFSTLTAFTGKSFRGRNYWPATGAAIGATGKFTFTQATMLTQYALLISGGIVGATGAPAGATLSVYSATRDISTRVTGLRTGDVPDIQRRRRQKTEIVTTLPI